MSFVREYLAPRFAGRAILDIGAGTGRWIHLWRNHGGCITSTDISPPHLGILRRRSKELGADVLRLDIAEHRLQRQFDLVYASMVLLHIPPTQIRAALDNIDAMAEDELLFTTWNRSDGTFDDESTSKIQSFSHDYVTLFRQVGWKVIFNCGVDYGRASSDPGVSRLWHLKRR